MTQRNERMLLPVLVSTSLVVSVISSLGAPLVPRIGDAFGVTVSTAQWSLTVTLLAGAVLAPILGRLGDGAQRRAVLLVGLIGVAAGNVLAALAPDFSLLLVGRALQGIGLGLMPIVMAIARDHLPPQRTVSAIAILSVTTAAGAGLGYPITGAIAQGFGFRGAFWFGAGVTVATVAAAWVVVPAPREVRPRAADAVGGVLLVVAVGLLLVTLGESSAWSVGLTFSAIAASMALLAGWVVYELRQTDPLVDLRLMRTGGVLVANVAALLLGLAMYMVLPVVIDLMEVPRGAAHGFGQSATVAGLVMVPFSVASVLGSRVSRWVGSRGRGEVVLPIGSAVLAAAQIFFAVEHRSPVEAFVVMTAVGLGLGLTFAAIPGLILRSVPPEQTGSAMGLYRVLQFIGISAGSAIATTIFRLYTQRHHSLPRIGGYEVTLIVGAAACVIAAVVSAIPAREPAAVTLLHSLRARRVATAQNGRAGSENGAV